MIKSARDLFYKVIIPEFKFSIKQELRYVDGELKIWEVLNINGIKKCSVRGDGRDWDTNGVGAADLMLVHLCNFLNGIRIKCSYEYIRLSELELEMYYKQKTETIEYVPVSIIPPPKDRTILIYGILRTINHGVWSHIPHHYTAYWDHVGKDFYVTGGTWQGPFVTPLFWKDLPKDPV